MRTGVLAGGTWIIDQVKTITSFPSQEELVYIIDEKRGNGGSAYNILKDLYRLGAGFPLEGIGMVGDDTRGRDIIKECKDLSIDTSQIRMTEQAGTSYTDVMSEQATGRRTFFHKRGANTLLDESHFDFSISNCKIFHLGYLLMLDRLDILYSNGKTGAAITLEKARNHGFLTSIDLVSDRTGEFRKIIPPSLPYTDFLFINEIESAMLTGIKPKKNSGDVCLSDCFAAANRMIEMGVRQWVFLHFQHGVIAVNKSKEILFQPCINLPADKIKGTVGAGDAFAAGTILGLHEEWDIRQCLQLGVCAAASCLLDSTCSDGILSYNECNALADTYNYRQTTLEG